MPVTNRDKIICVKIYLGKRSAVIMFLKGLTQTYMDGGTIVSSQERNQLINQHYTNNISVA